MVLAKPAALAHIYSILEAGAVMRGAPLEGDAIFEKYLRHGDRRKI